MSTTAAECSTLRPVDGSSRPAATLTSRPTWPRPVKWGRLGVSAAAVVLIALRLSDLSSLASAMAFRAGARAGTAFTAYHAGFGWPTHEMDVWHLYISNWLHVSLATGVILGCVIRLRKAWKRFAAGSCVNCGYDLRASPHRCPECGTIKNNG